MNKVNATEEQLKAIKSELASFTVRASAGSGKTTVLVQKYLRHVVEQKMRPDQILTITFTRKAAAEMKGRIVSALREEGHHADAQIAETGPIQTIHSLCERLLRENSLAAGIDPRFTVMPEATFSALVEESVRWCLATELDEYRYAEKLVSHLAGRRVYDATHAVHAKLGQTIRTVLNELRGSGKTVTELREMYSDHEHVIDLWMNNLLREFPEEIAEACREQPPENIANIAIAEFKKLGFRKPSWLSRNLIGFDEKAAEHTCGLMQLALLAWDWLDTQMFDKQEFDFTMLEERAVKLVQHVPQSALRIKQQYKVMLVDEAQDVNPVQYKLLSAMGVQSEMLVGDPQQSIYGFRLADRELFISKSDTASHSLTKNFRSDDGILKFVDSLFSRIWLDDYQPMLPEKPTEDDPFGDASAPTFAGVEFWPQEAKDSAATAAGVEQLIKEGMKAKSIAVLTRYNKMAHDVSEQLSNRGIATRVLGGSERFYTRLEVRDIANALDSLVDRYSDFQLLALLRSPFVGLSMDSIVLLSQRKPVIEALKEFDPPQADDAEKISSFLDWFLPISKYADRVPAWEVLSELFQKTVYLQQIAKRPNAEQTLANVRKLFTLATQDPLLGAHAYAEKIRQVQELKHREGEALSIDEDADAVTIMTVHRSKGLEFDTVVLPDTHAKLKPYARDLLVDARKGLVLTRFTNKHSMASRWLSDTIANRAIEEELRVLYVAMTRAKSRLCIVVTPTPNEMNAAGVICSRMGYGDNPPPGVLVRRPLGTP